MEDTRVKVTKRKLGQIGKQIGTKYRCLQRNNSVTDCDSDSESNKCCTGLKTRAYYAIQPDVNKVTCVGTVSSKTDKGMTECKPHVTVETAVGDGEQTKPSNINTTKGNNVFERNDSGYDSAEGFDDQDESDVIIANDITLSLKPAQPKSIDRRTSWSRLSGESPVENHLFHYGDLNQHNKVFGIIKDSPGPSRDTPIRIFHKYQDSDQGDEFGATLRTWETMVKGEKIRQHFLVGVERQGPADVMRIKNDDEIVLLNDIFVPERTHNEVIQLFHHVKVDGETRFRLVIRRVHKQQEKRKCKSSKKTWQWMETSAILAPDYKHILNEQPVVEAVESKFLPSNMFNTPDRKQRYQTPNHHLFIDINEHGLIANKNVSRVGDKTKIILRQSRYAQNGSGQLTYYAALSDVDKKRYIHIGKDGVTLQAKEQWFAYNAIGSNVLFMKDEMYLACNEDTGKIEVLCQPYKFHEIPADMGFDRPDDGMGATFDCTSSGETTTSTNKRILHLSLNAGKHQCNKELSSTITYDNILGSSESSSEDNSPCEMDTDECPENYLYTQPLCPSMKTPTTPMMSLFINKANEQML